MNQTVEKMLDILNVCREKGLKGYAEIDDLEETSHYEIEIEGLEFAECFSFYWQKEEAIIHYSALYEVEDDKSINPKIYDLLEYPFNKLSVNEGKSALEIEGYIKEDEYTHQAIVQILDYLMKGHNIIEELDKIAKHVVADKIKCKKRCDVSLYKVCQFYITYGTGGAKDVSRKVNVPFSEVKNSIKTLEHIGVIKKDEDFEYVLADQCINKIKEHKRLINYLNKELKKHERQNIR